MSDCEHGLAWCVLCNDKRLAQAAPPAQPPVPAEGVYELSASDAAHLNAAVELPPQYDDAAPPVPVDPTRDGERCAFVYYNTQFPNGDQCVYTAVNHSQVHGHDYVPPPPHPPCVPVAQVEALKAEMAARLKPPHLDGPRREGIYRGMVLAWHLLFDGARCDPDECGSHGLDLLAAALATIKGQQ